MSQPATSTAETTAQNTPTPTNAPTQVVPIEPVVINLTLWVPPQFAPSQDTEAGILLQDRLEMFNQLYPNLQISYRIKAESGPASLVESLYSASGVAPLVLPDLVLLPTSDMHIAAEQNLIFPYPEGYPADDDTDWYSVAAVLSSHQSQRYLLPLGADALVMVYNPEQFEMTPRTWADLLNAGKIISFPAAEPQAIFTLAQYLSQGGLLRDTNENIILEPEPLATVFTNYDQSLNANILPPNVTQIVTDEDAWTIFSETEKQAAITWTSRYFAQTDGDLQATTIPTTEGQPFTLVTGWGWALANPDPNKQAAAAELAQFLTEGEFAGQWTQATYLLPLRPFALTYWQNEDHQILASQLLPISTRVPPPDILNLVSTPITDAILDVFTDVHSPEEAAQIAVDNLGN
ncbi:MAG: extracellular solute-binding protein [Gammaproteobacteria bacterium]|nr:extracellular solute-binding protein [Gammaproteobacteria bacterium]